MNFSTKSFIFGECEMIHQGRVEQIVESDIILPDYCPDITKILKCTVVPQIISTSITGDRATIDGKAQIRLIYADENNSIKCYEQAYQFSKYFEDASISDNITAVFDSKVEYVNCRAISPRKADVRSSIVFMFKLLKKKSNEIISGAEGCSVQMRSSDSLLTDFNAVIEKSFSVGEVVEIPSSMPGGVQVIRESAVVIPGDVRIINNKVLIKGELCVSIYYCDESGNINCVKKSIPITQVVEIEEASEDSRADVACDVCFLEVHLKADTNAEMRLLDVNARISSCITVSCDKGFNMISDVYSTQYELDCQRKAIKLYRRKSHIKDTSLCKKTLDFSTTGIKELYDIWTSNVKTKTRFKENSIIITGNATVSVIYMDRDNTASYAERDLDFEYKKTIDDVDSLSIEPKIQILTLNAIILDDNSLELKAEYSVNGEIYRTEMQNLITALSVLEEKSDKSKSCPMTIYYPDVNESVWDIARKYNSTVEKIMEENSLSEDRITKRCMLMITSV